MAATTNAQVIIDAKDNATHVIKGVGSSVSQIAKGMELDFKGAGIAATAFLGSLTALAAGAIKVASSFEQNRISFETMMGSAEGAKKMMTDLAKFTLETPFEMPQVVQGAKSLMAYGISAEKIIPTFKVLGDIAAGVGMDKLPNLVLAFGQVKAATRLTGMELRQFTEAGVPLLDMLAEQFKKPVSAIKDMVSAGTVGFADVEQALTTLTSKGGKFQDLMLKQSKSFAGLMSNIKDKITQTMSEVAGVSVATGEVREGSLFAVLKSAAEKLYAAIDVVTPKLVAFSNWASTNKTFLMTLAGVIGGLLTAAIVGLVIAFGPAIALATAFAAAGALVATAANFVAENFKVLEPILIGLGVAIGAFALTQIPMLITAFAGLVSSVVTGAVTMIASLLPIIWPFVLIGVAVGVLYAAWTNNWGGIQEKTQIVINWFTGVAFPAILAFFNSIVEGLKKWVATWQERLEAIKTAADSVFTWIKDKVEGVVNFIRDLIDNFRPTIKIGLDLPDIVGAWNSLKQKAHNIGVPGFQTGGIVPGPIGAPMLATVHGGERVSPIGRTSGGGGGGETVFNVSIGLYAGTETEKRNVAKELYGALLQVAQSQNKNIQEYMGG